MAVSLVRVPRTLAAEGTDTVLFGGLSRHPYKAVSIALLASAVIAPAFDGHPRTFRE
jgi:hypothetical protein